MPTTLTARTGPVSVASLPLAPPQPWVDPAPVAAPGRVSTGVLRSAELGNERAV